MDELPTLAPVKLTCTSRDCENDKHCYRPKRGGWKSEPVGECQGCGDRSVDMSVTRARDRSAPNAIFCELGREFIRDHYLQKPIDRRARRLIRRDGVDGVRAKAADRLRKSIGGEPDAFDGRQTKLEGNVLFYAQHATATCCRRCAWYWYGIPMTGPMADHDLAFCIKMVDAYLDGREGEMRAIEATAEKERRK